MGASSSTIRILAFADVSKGRSFHAFTHGLRFNDRQLNDDPGPTRLIAIGPHESTVILDNSFHDGQSQTSAFFFRTKIRLKNPAAITFGNSRPIIGNFGADDVENVIIVGRYCNSWLGVSIDRRD